ncbi:hypothetical protein SERLA73DRAFT_178060, partial [Serpula lacrymans var. lacrymans S7.3]
MGLLRSSFGAVEFSSNCPTGDRRSSTLPVASSTLGSGPLYPARVQPRWTTRFCPGRQTPVSVQSPRDRKLASSRLI